MYNFRKNKMNLIVTILCMTIIAGTMKYYYDQPEAVTTFSMPTNKKIIVIDAGHGGWDPGKVSKSGIEEKDINLKIVEKLQVLLEESGAYVIVTRGSDVALAQTKRADLYGRKMIADSSQADIFISIHQNSYPEGSVRGAQAFYYGDSEEGKRLAEEIQNQFAVFIDKGNKRPAAANQNYYVLKKTTAPSVLVECGFLSNWNESKLLNDEQYQEKVAWTIYTGIVNFFAEQPLTE